MNPWETPPAVVIEAQDELSEYRAIDSRVDQAEDEGIWARWEFGRKLATEREENGGRQLPHGRIGELAVALGKSEGELRNRMQFAQEYPTEAKVAHALATFGSWHGVVKKGLGLRGLWLSESNEWYTPSEYVEAARQVMGGIDLDPASSPEANKTVQAATFYTADDDGLTKPWSGRVWMNPPYGGWSAPFTRRLVDEYEAGNVEAAVFLVNAHSTDTQWFQPFYDYTLCFTDHRIRFHSPTGKSSGSPHGSLFVYLGPKPETFAQVFAQFGSVLRRWP